MPEAARALGISERAVRKRVTAGTLAAQKDGHAWAVFLPAGTGAGPGVVTDVTSTELGAVPDAEPEPWGGTQAGTKTAPGAVPDLAPLADLIGELTRENRRLAEAAAILSERNRLLSERLLALEAGPTAGDATAEDSPQTAPDGPRAMEPAGTAQSPSRPWWRRLFGG